jgi:hypothetical protein
VNISLDHDVDSSDTIKLHQLVGIVAAATHQCHVLALGIVLFVALRENSVLGKLCGER